MQSTRYDIGSPSWKAYPRRVYTREFIGAKPDVQAWPKCCIQTHTRRPPAKRPNRKSTVRKSRAALGVGCEPNKGDIGVWEPYANQQFSVRLPRFRKGPTRSTTITLETHVPRAGACAAPQAEDPGKGAIVAPDAHPGHDHDRTILVVLPDCALRRC